tara:strand:- start:158 stop:391 length:234 start_codon:yes stop_codon:yes gene_type:complete
MAPPVNKEKPVEGKPTVQYRELEIGEAKYKIHIFLKGRKLPICGPNYGKFGQPLTTPPKDGSTICWNCKWELNNNYE